MNPILTANDLFDAQQAALRLRWLAGKSGQERLLEPATARFPGMALVGYLNFVHPNRVQVLGSAEVEYLRRLPDNEHSQAIQNIFACATTTMVVVANGETVDADLIQAADAAGLPLLTSSLPGPKVIDHLQHYLTRSLAVRDTQHGVYLEVMVLGVFVTGESGIGKSELALELISRGHRLVADDIVDFFRISPERVEGRCPALLQDFLEVRGLGILNIRAIFGDNSVKPTKPLDLIIQLEMADKLAPQLLDRLNIKTQHEEVLGVKVPKVLIPIAAGRNIAVLVEVAIRNHMLLLRGINATKQFTQRQQREMKKNR